MSKILITGGAGFIGSHLCDLFVNRGDEVICVDNFLSGSRKNIEHLLSNPNFTLIEQDVIDPLIINDRLSAIFHFACPASPNPTSPISYMTHPIETLMVNSLGSKNMLDLAVKNNCQIILASTSEIYGDPLVHPQAEDYWGNVSSIGVRSCYDEGKRFMEALSFAYLRKHQAKVKVVRIFNTYGPRMRLDDGRFTINLIDCAINNKPFIMHGNGAVTRSFCYIDDLLTGIIKVSESDAMLGQVINLGNPTELTLSKALEIFETILGRTLSKQSGKTPADDPKRRCPDIKKAQSLFGWNPQVDFAEGMKRTLASYQTSL